jgi:hypothetical protein
MYAPQRFIFLFSCLLASSAVAQIAPRPTHPGHKLRVKIDSQPQQAAIYIDSKGYGIEGYTPSTLRLPKGSYTVILELPGFRTVEKQIQVQRSQAFVFTMERQTRPAVLDIRAQSGNDAALGATLVVDGAQVGTVPLRVEVAPGHHLVEVKKTGFKDYRDAADVAEGAERTVVIDLQPESKKGILLVTADVPGAEVFVDGQHRETAPALVSDLTEGPHTVEVRKDPLPPWKQVVTVAGDQQVKVNAKIAAEVGGSLRIVSQVPGTEVTVDGEPKGAANVEIANLRPGQHLVEIRARNYAPQVLEVTIAAGEQRIARAELVPQAEKQQVGRLRVVSAVPDAEVFVDGAAMGKAPFDRADVPAGKHFVVVRKQGFADWKRELDLEAGGSIALTAELSASGTLKVLSNIAGADVYVDGQPLGKTPLTVPDVPAGEHILEVKHPGYVPAKQTLHVNGGEQKVLSADLAPVRTGPSPADVARKKRSMSSFSAVTVDPGRFTADVAAGFFPFGQARLTVGALRMGMLGVDAGVEIRTIGYFTDGGAHGKVQLLRAGPVAVGVDTFFGGGGGPNARTDFTFELGAPVTLLFGDLVRFTAHPYLQVYTDRLCPTRAQLAKDPTLDEGRTAACTDTTGKFGQNPRNRFVGARLMLQAALEIAVHQVVSVFFILEGDPIGQRRAYTKAFDHAFFADDPQIYGRAGVTFKF